MNRHGTLKLLKITVIALGIITVLGYALFATHDFLIGPTISLSDPTNGATFTKPDVRIQGVVNRIKDITLNGRSITIDDKGNFNEAVLLAPGYNIFELIASDKFGRKRQVRLELVYAVN